MREQEQKSGDLGFDFHLLVPEVGAREADCLAAIAAVAGSGDKKRKRGEKRGFAETSPTAVCKAARAMSRREFREAFPIHPEAPGDHWTVKERGSFEMQYFRYPGEFLRI